MTTAAALPSRAEIAERVPRFDHAAAVFLSGSIVAGFGHANSDVDVFVCFPSRDDLERVRAAPDIVAEPSSGSPVAVFYVEDVRWDVEFVHTEEIESLLRRLEAIQSVEKVPLADTEIDLLYRIVVGRPLSGAPLVELWQQRIASSRLREALTSRYLDLADGMLDDALGFLESGDIHTAAYCARSGFEFGIQALLAADGRICPSVKWHIAQLRDRPAGSVTVDHYLDVVEMRGFDGLPWVQRVVDRVRDLAFEL
jgi:predicted nucleotidyltransferase